jgi:hypothetical protein
MFARKTSDTTRTSTTTPTADPHLTLPVEANKAYAVKLMLFHAGPNGTADFKIQFAVPAGSSYRWGATAGMDPNFEPGNAATVPNNLNTESTTGVVMGSTTGTSGQTFGSVFEGVLETGGTAGDITLEWAQNVSDPGNSVMRQKSFLRLTEMP